MSGEILRLWCHIRSGNKRQFLPPNCRVWRLGRTGYLPHSYDCEIIGALSPAPAPGPLVTATDEHVSALRFSRRRRRKVIPPPWRPPSLPILRGRDLLGDQPEEKDDDPELDEERGSHGDLVVPHHVPDPVRDTQK